MEVIFLGLDEIIAIHENQLQLHGGISGIRNLDLLKSAAAMPAAAISSDYLHSDIYEMAAAYLFHITKNHPFLDGNKRAGATAAVVFLLMNGVELVADEDSFERLVWAVAEEKTAKAEITRFFCENSQVVGPI